jgi:nitrogen fixation protein
MINITDNFRVNKPAPIDDRLGPFVSTASALSSIEIDRRHIGLTVIIDDGTGAVEYWFKDGVTNGDLEAKASGGPGGNQTLQQVTDEGNTTTTDIVLLEDAELVIGAQGQVLLDNGSRLKEGTIDAGLGGAKGIAQICAVGYEKKWEAGREYIMNDGGTTIRESRYNFAVTPTVNDDVTKGYVIGSRWVLDNGDVYVCSDPTEGASVWTIQPDFVPYTGATENVDLGTYNLTADQLALNVNPTGTLAVGATEWNNTLGSSQTLLKGGSVTLKNGVDLVARIVNKVNPNTTLTKASYQVVKVAGAQGQRLAVDLARANTDLNSADTLGVVTETIAPNQEGFILTVGQLENINTTGSLQGETWADGDVLYLSPTTAGRMTNVKPNGLTGHIVVIGYVEYAHANNGKIYVKIMNGWELDELHNVFIDPATLVNNDALIYESSSQLWKNKVIDISASQMTSGTLNKARLPKVIPAVAIAGSAFTSGNTTAETIMSTLTIPANTLNVGDVIRISGFMTYNTAATKSLRVKFGTTTAGTAIYSPASLATSVTSTQIELLAVVTGSTTLRFSTNTVTGNTIYGNNTGALVSQTIDRTQPISFIITVAKTSGPDTVTCESAFLEIITS